LYIERKPAYYNQLLMGCANYEEGTDKYAGFQLLCCDCKETTCPFENILITETLTREPEACAQCKTVHNENKCPKCNYCWVCEI